jgi:hypothetical protein
MIEAAKPGGRVPTSLFCAVCYFMGVMALSFELLPPDALAIFGGRPKGDTWRISLTMAGISFALAAVLHVVLYRLNPRRFDTDAFRKGAVGMGVMLALLFGLSIALSRGTGLPDAVLKARVDRVVLWVGMIVLALGLLLIPGSLLLLYLAVCLQPVNRMARRLADGDAAGAIRIGEARPPDQRDFGTRVNLVAAYAMAHRMDDARALLAELDSAGWDPTVGPEDQYRSVIDRLRGIVDGDASAPTSPSGGVTGGV